MLYDFIFYYLIEISCQIHILNANLLFDSIFRSIFGQILRFFSVWTESKLNKHAIYFDFDIFAFSNMRNYN